MCYALNQFCQLELTVNLLCVKSLQMIYIYTLYLYTYLMIGNKPTVRLWVPAVGILGKVSVVSTVVLFNSRNSWGWLLTCSNECDRKLSLVAIADALNKYTCLPMPKLCTIFLLIWVHGLVYKQKSLFDGKKLPQFSPAHVHLIVKAEHSHELYCKIHFKLCTHVTKWPHGEYVSQTVGEFLVDRNKAVKTAGSTAEMKSLISERKRAGDTRCRAIEWRMPYMYIQTKSTPSWYDYCYHEILVLKFLFTFWFMGLKMVHAYNLMSTHRLRSS